MQTYQSNQLLVRFGVYLYAAAILAFGIIYFTGHHALSGLIPIGGTVFFKNIWGYIFGTILTLFGLSLLIPGVTRQSSFLLGVFLFVILLFVHLPLILLNPSNPNDWTSLMEMACLSAGAFILSDVLLPLDAPNEGLSRMVQAISQIARVVFSLALFGFGILHFMYADFIGTLIPDWLPARVFLAYFVGACFFAAGISILFRRITRPAMILLFVMFAVWVLILHAPRAFATPASEPEWTSMFNALAMAGIALFISVPAPRLLRRPGWPGLLLCCCFFGNTGAQAQEAYVRPAVKLSSFPFTTLTGGVILVAIQLDGYPDTLHFVIDTGSAGMSIDSTTSLRLNLLSVPSDVQVLGIGGTRNVRFVLKKKIHIGSLAIDSLNMHISDYSLLSSVYGEKIDGILGFSFLNRFIVKIDYDSQIVTIFSRGYMRYPKGGFLLHPTLVSLPVQAATIRESLQSNCRFYFDTGAGLCLLLTTDFLKDTALFAKSKTPLPTQAQGLGGKANMQITTLKEFKLGPYKFKNIPTHIFDDEYNVTAYPALAGLIGNDILRRFNILLNYEKKCFYLTPNTHYNDPFDYSYTGLGLYWEETGEITVGDIQKGSPAAKAGFEVGDVVQSVNYNDSKNLQVYKTMMQNIGSNLRFNVLREKTMVTLTMRVKSIL